MSIAYSTDSEGRIKIRLEITRKPPPPPLDNFECVICAKLTARDPYNPEWEAPPVCNRCAYASSHSNRIDRLPFIAWSQFAKANALLGAIKKEVKNARTSN